MKCIGVFLPFLWCWRGINAQNYCPCGLSLLNMMSKRTCAPLRLRFECVWNVFETWRVLCLCHDEVVVFCFWLPKWTRIVILGISFSTQNLCLRYGMSAAIFRLTVPWTGKNNHEEGLQRMCGKHWTFARCVLVFRRCRVCSVWIRFYLLLLTWYHCSVTEYVIVLPNPEIHSHADES
jgi:hypothetical protein